ncbi:type 4a pilus biogenesis protein PilO [Vibrio sp. 10N.222.54.F12]|jgi:MSHA biogenesis protein MshJ|uniref:MSHA biogenesis protein MshJ n=3 Tax=Vibrio TaxID=662 RepID=A0A2N7I8V0_9VIBR|nr:MULTISPECIES: type 4a pilus biogenesis protein PilO [Vibrio]EAQ52533.1 Glucose-6-phosphate isomerase [Vibrio sp. MED222]OEF68620.1 MSHA biogenesis protein MshJ [Vibrio tasmaniensis 1F-187]OEF71036.1 MSHA biogenesis protein MshJ [Vibrio tasmaniensis 1F-155]PML12292.1 MSHA biogenesis protein MshJ [Vibrio tasmaniensis]PML52662.1 MSHA biogenesis protein MshJ [Vibrio tasmaniensis]
MQLWNQLSDKFLALSLREKWLLFVCGLVGLSMLVFTLLIEPAYLDLQEKNVKSMSLTQSNQKQQGELLVLQAKLNKDPDKEIDLELKKLLVESQELSFELAEIVDRLVTPSQMAQLLESVLNAGNGLKLESLESLQPEAISDNQENSDNSKYFLHPVRMELTGSYFDISIYLQALESLPVSYYWRTFEYSVEEYPKARLVFEVYTLGTRQEFIGG